MAYGLAVATSVGDLVDLSNVSSARMHKVIHATGYSGSVSVPTWNSPDGDFFVVNNTDTFKSLAFKWDNATKILEWWNHSPRNDEGYANDYYVFLVDT